MVPVLSSTVISGHPVFSGPFSKSQNFFSKVLQFLLPFRGQSHPLLSPNGLFVLSATCVVRSLKSAGTQIKLRIIFQVQFNPRFSPKINVSSIYE